jgi:ribosomal protein L17
MLLDVAISGGRNMIKKETEKILKYTDLTTEIQRTCNVKARVIPLITMATGTILKSLKQYLGKIPGKQHEVKELKKQPYWGTEHILQKIIM